MSWKINLCVLLAVINSTLGEIKNKEWWKKAVFYQIYPRSFMDSDNDGIGDLKGVTARLEHFVDSGIDAIWLSPIYKSPQVDFGYDISDFKSIDPRFGTIQDFEELTSRARKLGIRVILDFVPNHTSDEHEWFQKSLAGDEKYKDYYVWEEGRNNDDKTPPNNWISIFSGSAWKYVPGRQKWYLHQFEYRQPDLNFTNPAVRAEMEDTLRFWLSKGVDGFRVDSAPFMYEDSLLRDEPRSYLPGYTDQDEKYLKHIYTQDDPRTYDLIKGWKKVLDDFADENNEDEKIMLTEAYTSLQNTTRYYENNVNVPFNFFFITDVTGQSRPSKFRDTIYKWIDNSPSYAIPNWVFGNHDNHRVATRYPGRADQMNMLNMILPGISVTYNGEEIGMVDKTGITWEETQDPQACNAGKEKYEQASRDPERTPFQWDGTKNAGFSLAERTWLPVNENYKELNLANQKKAEASHYKIYRELTKLKRTSSALREGSHKTLVLNDDSVLAVIREAESESIILLINFSNDRSQTVNVQSQVRPAKQAVVLLASLDSQVKPGTTVDLSNVNLPAKASLVIKATR